MLLIGVSDFLAGILETLQRLVKRLLLGVRVQQQFLAEAGEQLRAFFGLIVTQESASPVDAPFRGPA
jgi:hypothetical protein